MNDIAKNSQPNIVKILFWVILISILAVGIYLRIKTFQSVHIGIKGWLTRDIDRALNIVDGIYFPLAGPESNAGGRLPGPFLYILLAIPLFIYRAYESVFVFNLFLNAASIAGFFFILKKYFGFYYSVIASSLFAVSIHHIASVGHPINPVFLFPVIVIYLGFLFEITLNKNIDKLPWLVLVLCLGIQIHYSIAILFLIPFILIYILGLIISKSIFIKCFAVILICFFPYAIHKGTVFEPERAGVKGTFRGKDLKSPIEIIKLITVQNEISRIASSFAFYPVPRRSHLQPEKEMVMARRIGLSVAFYGLCLFLLIRCKNKKAHQFPREVVIFNIFYISALTYEIVKPHTNHHWYTYILILPVILVLTWFLILICSNKNYLLRVSGILITVIFFCFHLNVAYRQVNGSTQVLQKSLTLGSYKNSKLLLREMMAQLKLSPKEFYERVYFLDFPATSFNRLEFNNINISNPIKSPFNKKSSCYFIFDEDRVRSNRLLPKERIAFQRDVLFFFKRDSNIQKKFFKNISFDGYGFNKSFNVIQYFPFETQSCYTNAFNPFLTDKSIRDILIQAKEKKRREVREIFVRESYGAMNKLVSFDAQYVIKNERLQTPFRVSVTIFKHESRYKMKVTIETYYFFSDYNYHMRSLGMNIWSIPKGVDRKSALTYKFSLERERESIKLNFFSRNTIASVNLGKSQLNSNKVWFREKYLPEKVILTRDNFLLYLTYEMGEYKTSPDGIWDTSQKTILNIKSPVVDNN
tara:strand:- start:2723 stop:4984 length:2262 start_codon:yes stop_codon:yes gene_type:complete